MRADLPLKVTAVGLRVVGPTFDHVRSKGTLRTTHPFGGIPKELGLKPSVEQESSKLAALQNGI